MNLDPRDIITADPYANLTSDEDEQSQIEKELQEMERRKKDLLKRLEQKRLNSKKVDPNFIPVEVPRTPEKKKSTSSEYPNYNYNNNSSTFNLNSKDSESSLTDGNDNFNEIKLKEKYANETKPNIPGSTTSYFVNRFQDLKRKEKLRIEAHENMMSSRIHTFGNNDYSKEYKPIIVNEKEEYSNLWISKRYIPESLLKETLQNIKILRLNKLFAKVRPPKFEEPQYSNWVTLGIISQKSEVKYTTGAKPQKFIKLTLTNLKQQIDVFIFGDSGVQKYITLRVGDIIAILNPEILPWKPSSIARGQTLIKSFNLKIAHKYNCILEIGKSRDLGYCPIWNKSTNRRCGNCIDISVEKCCEYHREIQMRSSNAKRPDLNGGYSMGAPTRVGIQPSIYRENILDRNLSNHNRGQHSFIQTKGNNMGKSTLNNGSNPPSFNLMSRTVGYNHQNEEELRRKSITARYFSSSNAAKAFFDDDFHNPDAIKKDLKNNKKRRIDEDTPFKKFDKMLNKMFNKDINLDEKSIAEINQLKSTTETVLQSGIIQHIGFDPTRGKIASVLNNKKLTSPPIKREEDNNNNNNDSTNFNNANSHHCSKNDKKDVVKELLSFKKDSVNLTPSAVHIMQRKEHRKAAWREVFGKEKDTQRLKKNDTDSDSDLEII